jgi:hypothetical protein
MRKLAMLVSRVGVGLPLFMLADIMVVGGLMMMVRGGVVMCRSLMMMFAGGML